MIRKDPNRVNPQCERQKQNRLQAFGRTHDRGPAPVQPCWIPGSDSQVSRLELSFWAPCTPRPDLGRPSNNQRCARGINVLAGSPGSLDYRGLSRLDATVANYQQ